MINTKNVVKNKWWVSAISTLVIVVFIVPALIVIQDVGGSIEIPQGKYIKAGNRIFFDFIEQLKSNGDVLILGTSETGRSLDGMNYWGLLDKDSTLSKRYFSFGGAGRCSYVYFPLLLDNPKAFDGLNVVLYINPTYWRKGLNMFREDYYSRYVDNQLLGPVKSKATELGIYQEFMKPVEPSFSFPIYGGRKIDDFRSLFYYDLNRILYPKSSPDFQKSINIDSTGLRKVENEMEQKINFQYNVTEEYLKLGSSFTVIDTDSDFQSNMLRAFIKLVIKTNINCLFYVGPVNEIYGQEKNPEFLEDHYAAIDEIKEILESSNMKYLDGTNQGKIPGTFDDVQHISELGAYLTAIQIKEYYEKGN